MRKLRYFIHVLFMLAVCQLPAQNLVRDSVKEEVVEQGDSLYFKMTVYQIETQLTFLMQGLTVSVLQPDTITITFPSAAMVRSKVRRHPNEVKAVLASRERQQIGRDSINHVIRPDVQPLVAALNDTTAAITYQGRKNTTHDFIIDVDRDRVIMEFSFKLAKKCISNNRGLVKLLISSEPLNHQNDRPEFVGKRLSGENAPRPNGLGEGIRKEDVSKRTYRKEICVKITNANEG